MTNETLWWLDHLTRIAKSDYAPCADAGDVVKIISEANARRDAQWREGLEKMKVESKGTFQGSARNNLINAVIRAAKSLKF